jgi:hypothetical protein
MKDFLDAMSHLGIDVVICDEEGMTMVAAHNTVDALHKLLLKYVPEDKLDGLMLELHEIPGNRSFRETVERLCELHEWTKQLKIT